MFRSDVVKRISYKHLLAWSDYGTLLRQVPQQGGFPGTITWPTIPAYPTPIPSVAPISLISSPLDGPPELSRLCLFSRSTQGRYCNKKGDYVIAIADLPRFDYDPLTHESLGLLIEGASVNRVLQSENLNTTPWTKSNVTVTENFSTIKGIPFNKVEATTAAATTYTQSLGAIGVAAGGTLSFFAVEGSSAVAGNKFVIRNATTSTNLLDITFNFNTEVLTVNGTPASGATARAIDRGDGVWEIIMSCPTGISAGNSITIYMGYTGATETANEYILLSRVQFEDGDSATSYIKTTTATASRGEDSCLVAVGPWFNPAEGTLYVEHNYDRSSTYADTARSAVQIDDNSPSNRITIGNNGGTRGGYLTRIANSVDASSNGVAASEAMVRTCVTFADNDYGLSIDGADIATDTVCAMPAGISVLRIGHSTTTLGRLNGHVRDLKYFPARLANAERLAMTA